MARIFLPSDLEDLNRWLAARGEAPVVWDEVGAGRVAPGLACGFHFILSGGSVALLDAFATNPEAPVRARYRALAEVVEAVIGDARARGARRFVGLTRSKGMEKLVKRFGFASAGDYRMLIGGSP